MKAIYTSVSKEEVNSALRKSALTAGTEFMLKKMAKNLLHFNFSKMVVQEVLDFIITLNSVLGRVPWRAYSQRFAWRFTPFLSASFRFSLGLGAYVN